MAEAKFFSSLLESLYYEVFPGEVAREKCTYSMDEDEELDMEGEVEVFHKKTWLDFDSNLD